jgi:superfamily I DNA/RNA helicase
MDGPGVTLITLHAAKGLEFPHVYLIGLEEGLLPHDRSKMEGTVDEERRLLYVGITRARQTLALTWCGHRIKYGSASPCTPSSFIKELPAEWTEQRNATQILNAPVAASAVKGKFGALKALLEKVPD